MSISHKKVRPGIQENSEQLQGKGNLTGFQAVLSTSEVPKMYKIDQPSQLKKEEAKKASVLRALPIKETLKRKFTGTEVSGKKNTTATSSTNDEPIIDKSIQMQRVLRSKSFPEEKNKSGAQLISSKETSMGRRQSTGTKDPIDSAQTNKSQGINSMTRQKQPEVKSSAEEQTLLTQTELNELCGRERRISDDVKTQCNKICSVIKNLHEDIEHVYPAYKLENENEIVFVVLSKTEIDKHVECKWTVVFKILNQNNKENNMNNPLPREKTDEISKVIDKYANSLMEEHMYLSAITLGTVKEKEACIILYTLAKSFIPLDEEAFAKELDNIPCHVREGEFRLCGGSADEVRNNLRMGCTITSSRMPNTVGTLGGFIEHPVYGLCGITCAHLFLKDGKMHLELKEKEKMKEDELRDITTYQSSYREENKVGPLVEMTYKQGKDKPGVDFALLKVERNAPTSGSFHDAEGEQNESFRSGFVWGKAGLPSDDRSVIKFGQTTKRTVGEILYDNTAVKGHRFEWEYEVFDEANIKKMKLTSTLFKQYLIEPEEGSFCALGDSGALVFMNDKEQNDLRCIGMVVGVMHNGMGIVTPIQAILEEMNVSGLKSFHFKYTMDEMDQRFDKLERQITDTIKSEISKLKDNK